MVDFIETVGNKRLHERLSTAIDGRGAFRRFKHVLLDASSERERWFAFKSERDQARAIVWLRSEGIGVTAPEAS